jgi:signal transduction histidine kinase
MLLLNFGTRMAAVIRLAGLAVISWTMVHGNPAPGTSGRRLLITVLFAAAVVAWLWWTRWPIRERGLTPDLYVLAAAGGVLIGASPRSASAAFVFVAAVAAAVRVPLERALIVTAIGALATAVSTIVYDRGALALLAYVLGFVAAALAASNARQSIDRAEQAELLLAQTQRSYEEQLRTARLAGSARIAREIHAVLAHTLAGLTIQLEATSALLQNGADRTDVLKRVKRAHELAREGLTETPPRGRRSARGRAARDSRRRRYRGARLRVPFRQQCEGHGHDRRPRRPTDGRGRADAGACGSGIADQRAQARRARP